MYSMKEYTFARSSWRKDRVGKPPPKPAPKKPPAKGGGGGLTSESLQQHAEDPSGLDWTKVAAKRRRAELASS